MIRDQRWKDVSQRGPCSPEAGRSGASGRSGRAGCISTQTIIHHYSSILHHTTPLYLQYIPAATLSLALLACSAASSSLHDYCCSPLSCLSTSPPFPSTTTTLSITTTFSIRHIHSLPPSPAPSLPAAVPSPPTPTPSFHPFRLPSLQHARLSLLLTLWKKDLRLPLPRPDPSRSSPASRHSLPDGNKTDTLFIHPQALCSLPPTILSTAQYSTAYARLRTIARSHTYARSDARFTSNTTYAISFPTTSALCRLLHIS